MALFAQVQDFLVALAASAPGDGASPALVVLLDDLHWADPASIELLRHLGHYLASLPLLLIVTYRTDELSRQHPLYPLLPTLVREADADRLDLHPLDEMAVRSLIATRYALQPADVERLAGYLQQHAGGNPLFLIELLRTLREVAALTPGTEGWRLTELTRVPVPIHLRQVIDGRLARLGEVAQRLLSIAAIIGQEVPIALWAAVARMDEEDLLASVERLIDAHILEEATDGAHVGFVHALIRETLYQGIRAPRRTRLHLQVGEAIAALARPDPDAVAYHLQEAGDERAAAWLVQAGERAQHSYAWLTAADRFAAALAIMDERGDNLSTRGWLRYRLALLRRFAEPHQSIDDMDTARRLGIEAGDRLLAAYATFFRGHCRCNAGDVHTGVLDMETGIAALDALTPEEAGHIRDLAGSGVVTDLRNHRGTLAFWLAQTGNFPRARAIAESVVAQERVPLATTGLGDSYGTAYYGLGVTHANLGDIAAARAAYRRAHAAYHLIGHHSMIGLACEQELNLVVLPYLADDLAARRAIAAEGERAMALASGAIEGKPPRIVLLLLLFVEAKWEEARALVAVRQGTGIDMTFVARQAAAMLAYEQGEPEAARAIVHAVLPHGPASPPGTMYFPTALALQRLAASLACDEGDFPTARAWLEAHDRWMAWSEGILGLADGDITWARYYRRAGEPGAARDRAMRALERATQPRQPLALLAAHRLLGELAAASGQLDEAAQHLDTALVLADVCAAPYERALTLLARAEHSWAADRATEADAAIAEVRAICTPLHAVRALAWADALAGTHAERHATPGDSAPHRLTRRELEILRQIAAGKSNREIADGLSVSIRTIERHITNLYRKIDARGKADATAYLFRYHLA
jgi:DNA-binding CsgD family transcriptional regulator